MKKTRLLLMVMCGFVLFSWVPALAYQLDNGTDVGGLDELLASKKLENSGDPTELDWVREVLGSNDYILDEKYNTNEANWEKIDGEETYALDLDGSPLYFFIKTGETQNGDDHFIFKNLVSLSWAVINLPGLEIKNVGKISHVGEVGGGGAPPQ